MYVILCECWNKLYLILSYFAKNEINSPNTYSETDIIQMVEFLIDNIYVEFGGHVYQQTVGIPMGTNCAPLVTHCSLIYVFI